VVKKILVKKKKKSLIIPLIQSRIFLSVRACRKAYRQQHQFNVRSDATV